MTTTPSIFSSPSNHTNLDSDTADVLLSCNSAPTKKTNKRNNKQKRPDRRLYSVREKQSLHKEAVKNTIEPATSENDQSFTSTVSTAISDRFKQMEDERSASMEKKSQTTIISDHESAPIDNLEDLKPAQSRVLFSFCLEKAGSYDVITVYDDEEDFKSFLEQVCQSHNMPEKMALYFKINLMNTIHEMHSSPERVEPYLNELLDINYKLLTAEMMCSEKENIDLSDFQE